LEDAGKNRMEAEYQDPKESGNDNGKADKPDSLLAEWGCMDIQNGEQAIEDDGERMAYRMITTELRNGTPKGRFHISGEAKSIAPRARSSDSLGNVPTR